MMTSPLSGLSQGVKLKDKIQQAGLPTPMPQALPAGQMANGDNANISGIPGGGGMQSPTVGPGNYVTPGGDIYDTHDNPPELGQIDFRQQLLPIRMQGPNAERAPAAGEPKAIATSDGLPQTFEQNSGHDPDADAATGVANEALAATRTARTQGLSAVDISKKPLSLGRKVAGVAAGVGMGMATMNPLAGVNFGMDVANYGRNKEAGVEAAKSSVNSKFGEDATKIGGLYGTNVEHKAQLGQSQAAQAQAKNKTTELEQQNKKVTPVTYGTGKAGEKQTGLVNEFGGPNQTPTPMGQPEVAKQTPDQVQIVKDKGGKYFAVDKEHPQEPIEIPEVVDDASKQAFDTYWNALPPAQRTAQAVLEFQKAGAAQSGENAQDAYDRARKDSDLEGKLMASVQNQFNKRAAVDPKLKTNPQSRHTVMNEILNEFAHNSTFGPYVEKVRKSKEFQLPTGKPGPFDNIMNEPARGPAAPVK